MHAEGSYRKSWNDLTIDEGSDVLQVQSGLFLRIQVVERNIEGRTSHDEDASVEGHAKPEACIEPVKRYFERRLHTSIHGIAEQF